MKVIEMRRDTGDLVKLKEIVDEYEYFSGSIERGIKMASSLELSAINEIFDAMKSAKVDTSVFNEKAFFYDVDKKKKVIPELFGKFVGGSGIFLKSSGEISGNCVYLDSEFRFYTVFFSGDAEKYELSVEYGIPSVAYAQAVKNITSILDQYCNFAEVKLDKLEFLVKKYSYVSQMSYREDWREVYRL